MTVSFVLLLSFLGVLAFAIPDGDGTTPFRPAIRAFFDDFVSSNVTDASFDQDGNLGMLMQNKGRGPFVNPRALVERQSCSDFCPDGGCCPSGYTCQQASGGQYGCCPVGQTCDNTIGGGCAE